MIQHCLCISTELYTIFAYKNRKHKNSNSFCAWILGYDWFLSKHFLYCYVA